MLQAGADVNWTDAKGESALVKAIHSQHLPVISILLRNDARTPSNEDMFGAVADDDKLLVGWMMDVGVDPNVRDEEGTTPLALAVEMELKDMEDLLRSYGPTNHPPP